MNKITFIGGGHIAQVLVEGLIKGGLDPSSITIANPTLKKLTSFSIKTGVQLTTDNRKACFDAIYTFITVRPSVVKAVIYEIKDTVSSKTLIISVAACVDIALLSRYFGNKKVKLVRIMPNIAVGEKKGVIGMLSNTLITHKEKKILENLLHPLGLLINCRSEDQLDRLSLISGCGPGVVGYLIQALKEEAIHLGFTPHQAEAIALKTFEGTIAHMKAANISPSELLAAIATPGGITERIIKTLSSKYPQLLRKSLMKGYDRITNVSKKLKEK